MLWTLDFDDYSGQFCNDGPFPLANAIKSVFDEYASIDSLNSNKSSNAFNMNNNSLMIEFDKQYTSTLDLTATSTSITKNNNSTSILEDTIIFFNSSKNATTNAMTDLAAATILVNNNKNTLLNGSLIQKNNFNLIKNSANYLYNCRFLFSFLILVVFSL